ncbi:hypothetical protein [Staphylococcus pettenkoferi]|uniref:hypothetical protein n=1 Tax=Staphylococcus pettenkoferi TaxID=170573 RepID=UPI00066D221D|nr:hypothetical protein [Staphylococcus pettenkoferi]MDK7114348.1 hypothetical protein [Staphylococcus pettenkoferi]
MKNNKLQNCIVICHGKSEYEIIKYIKNAYRIPVKIVAENKGKNSIQITSIMQFLNRREFKTKKQFENKFKIVVNSHTKIFIIMDTDDCSKMESENFKNGKMFRRYWGSRYIHPIFNTLNLEDVISRTQLEVYHQKKDAVKIFPQNISDKHEGIMHVYQAFKKAKHTNFDEVFEYFIQYKD